MKKRILAILLTLCLLVSLVACEKAGGPPANYEGSAQPSSASPSVSASMTETTSEPALGTDSRIEQMENAVLQYPGENDEWKYNVYDCYVELTKYKGPVVETLVVPAEIEGLPVWKCDLLIHASVSFNDTYYVQGLSKTDIETIKENVEAGAWTDSPYERIVAAQEIKEIELPSCLLWIAPYAFCGCTNLSKINLPEGLYYIGDYAFSRCKSLAQIEFPKSLKVIERGLFCQAGLTSVELPEGVLSVGYAAFADNPLTEIIFPDSLTQIDQLALYGCAFLEKVTIPASVESISESSFFGCGYQYNSSNEEWERVGIDITILGSDTSILRDKAKPNRVTTIIQADFSVLHGRAGSLSAMYCSEMDIPFQVITD